MIALVILQHTEELGKRKKKIRLTMCLVYCTNSKGWLSGINVFSNDTFDICSLKSLRRKTERVRKKKNDERKHLRRQKSFERRRCNNDTYFVRTLFKTFCNFIERRIDRQSWMILRKKVNIQEIFTVFPFDYTMTADKKKCHKKWRVKTYIDIKILAYFLKNDVI